MRPLALVSMVLPLALACGRIEYANDGSPPDASPDATGDAGPRCGDGDVTPVVEQCDDSNVADGDGCSALCMLEDQGPGAASCLEARVLQLSPVGAGRLMAVASGSTSGAFDTMTGSCGGSGNDHVLALTVERTSDLTVTLENPGAADLVVYVRGVGGAPCLDASAELACANDPFSGASETIAQSAVPPGGYYAIIDSTGGASAYRATFLLVPR